MRFMMFMYPGLQDEAAWQPSPETVAAMTKYNEELTKAGVLLALDGLQPASKGARVSFPDGKPTVTDGPFAEAKELVGGYWIIDVKSKDEAVAWASRCPTGGDSFIEVRQVYEMTDFPADVQAAAGELSQAPPEQTSPR
ncbi:MAG: hypothetical protein JWQ48_1196 [Conexibacter sp.]|nr:hypothetical protein [Conexibacter sp.]